MSYLPQTLQANCSGGPSDGAPGLGGAGDGDFFRFGGGGAIEPSRCIDVVMMTCGFCRGFRTSIGFPKLKLNKFIITLYKIYKN